jgi:type I restriction enzyme S subunit
MSKVENTITTGQAYPQIGLKQVREAVVLLPHSKAEQESIASALSDTDALIESIELVITKKRHIKQGSMQDLLTGKKRLPGFSGEWVECQLRDCLLANPDYGINAPGVPASGDLPVYLRITDIDDDGNFIANNRVAVNHPQSPNYILNENEIVFARTGASVGKTYLYDLTDGAIVFAGFLIRARIDSLKMSPTFFAAFTRTGRYWNWIRVMSMRSGQPGINGNEYASLDLLLPPLPEQVAIATIFTDMDTEIAALETKLVKARQIKQGMMEELLTGRIRLV